MSLSSKTPKDKVKTNFPGLLLVYSIILKWSVEQPEVFLDLNVHSKGAVEKALVRDMNKYQLVTLAELGYYFMPCQLNAQPPILF